VFSISYIIFTILFMQHWGLFYGLRIWKCPGSIQDLLPRPIQPNDVIPSRYDRHEVGLLWVTPEVDVNTPVFVLLCSDVVEGISVVLVDRLPTIIVLALPACQDVRAEYAALLLW
jgi:hypothetical protein